MSYRLFGCGECNFPSHLARGTTEMLDPMVQNNIFPISEERRCFVSDSKAEKAELILKSAPLSHVKPVGCSSWRATTGLVYVSESARCIFPCPHHNRVQMLLRFVFPARSLIENLISLVIRQGDITILANQVQCSTSSCCECLYLLESHCSLGSVGIKGLPEVGYQSAAKPQTFPHLTKMRN